MITVRNRTLIVPEGERVIGTDYDSNSEVRQFRVEKAPGGIDISHLVFRLDLMYQGRHTIPASWRRKNMTIT